MNNEGTQKLVLGWVKWILDTKTEEMSELKLCKDFTSAMSEKAIAFANSTEFRNIAYEFTEDILKENEKSGKSIKEFLPQGIENNLKVLVYNKSPQIAASIKKYINGEKFENMIKTQVSNFTKGVNPMVAKFVSGKSIHTKVVNSLNTYIDDTNNVIKIVMFINDKIDEINNQSLKEVLDYMPYEGKSLMIKSYVDSVLNLCNNEQFTQRVEHEIYSKILTYETVGNLFEHIGLKEDEILDEVEKSITKYLKTIS